MKKLVLAAFAAALSISTPVLAQSANDMRFYDRANDPAYQAAARSRYYYGGSGYGYEGNNSYVDNTQATIECKSTSVLILFGSSKCTRTPQAMICYTPAGDPIQVDSSGARFVGGSNSGRSVPREVTLNCGNNGYHASN